jgi:hypothetical protein
MKLLVRIVGSDPRGLALATLLQRAGHAHANIDLRTLGKCNPEIDPSHLLIACPTSEEVPILSEQTIFPDALVIDASRSHPYDWTCGSSKHSAT